MYNRHFDKGEIYLNKHDTIINFKDRYLLTVDMTLRFKHKFQITKIKFQN